MVILVDIKLRIAVGKVLIVYGIEGVTFSPCMYETSITLSSTLDMTIVTTLHLWWITKMHLHLDFSEIYSTIGYFTFKLPHNII